MGLRHYHDEELETRDKWAILALFHAIELLLKERLHREHPLLIYRNLDKKIDDGNSPTVGLQEIRSRFDNLAIKLADGHARILDDLQGRRNRIEHHRFIPNDSHRPVLGKALKFITYFLEVHLGEQLEDLISAEQFDDIKELVLSYDELVCRAEASVDAALSHFHPKDHPLIGIGTCPQCGNRTVLVDSGEESFCHFCRQKVQVNLCDYCGEHLPPGDFMGSNICYSCFSDRVDRD